jgi:sec-independent protein translocase protein TatA
VSTPGATELLIVLFIVLLILGPKRLPSLGRQLGGGIREFRRSLGSGGDRSSRRGTGADHPTVEPAPSDAPAPTAAPVASAVPTPPAAPAAPGAPAAPPAAETASGERDPERRSV